MTSVAPSPAPLDVQPSLPSHEHVSHVGVATRAVSWFIDAVIISLVAILAGVGTALVLSLFPVGNHVPTALKAVAGAAYVLWVALYFIVFWSTTGQTPGARTMQIRLVAPTQPKVRPPRAILRWVGMNLAMLPLFAGYLPILFGRRPFPDWLARTRVVEAPQMSFAEARRETLRLARPRSGPL